jgi:hypothetical protein
VAADPDEGTDEVEAVEAAPAVLALVDACWEGEEGEGGLEAVRSALAAALEALPACGRFGLVSFGSKVRPRVLLQNSAVPVLRQRVMGAEG